MPRSARRTHIGLLLSLAEVELVSLLEDLASVPTTKPRLAEWVISLTPDERKAFDEAIANPNASPEFLAEVVRKHGGRTTRNSIIEWREKHVAR